jgi:hypothetical protein
MKKFHFLMLISLIFMMFTLTGCGNEAPVLSNLMYNILIYQAGSLNIPNDSIFLSVYCILDDPNGLDDITQVKITHIETEYSWIIPKETIIHSNVFWNDKKYYGFSFLEFDNAKSILTGEYSIEATDSVGNITTQTFFVEVEGLASNEPYRIPEIDYKVNYSSKNHEMKISGGKYSSCELKLLNNAKAFNGGRKKFSYGKDIILDEELMSPRTQISVRLNKDEDGNIVYFLKNYITD